MKLAGFYNVKARWQIATPLAAAGMHAHVIISQTDACRRMTSCWT
jgi:hypothetical protein